MRVFVSPRVKVLSSTRVTGALGRDLEDPPAGQINTLGNALLAGGSCTRACRQRSPSLLSHAPALKQSTLFENAGAMDCVKRTTQRTNISQSTKTGPGWRNHPRPAGSGVPPETTKTRRGSLSRRKAVTGAGADKGKGTQRSCGPYARCPASPCG